MSIGRFLFGEDVPPKTGVLPVMTPEQIALVDLMTRQAAAGAERGISPYTGILTTTMPPAAEALLAGRPALTGGLPQAWEDYYQQAIRAPMEQQFQRQTLPGVRGAYVGPGTFWGSERAKAEAQAYSDFAQQLAAQRANLALQAEREAASRILGLTPISLQQQAGDIQRLYGEYLRTHPTWMDLATQALAYKPYEPYVMEGYRRPGLIEALAGPAAKVISARIMRR